MQLEATVKRLAQVVSTLTLTVTRLADEPLGEQAPDNPADPHSLTDPDGG